LRGEGRGEGLFFELEKKRVENPVQILDELVVPDADQAIAGGTEVAVALPVFGAFRVLTTVELDN
jgi:hypothetical protein